MYSLSCAKPDLLDLFDGDGPGTAMLFSILEGRGPAEILVDDPDRPTQCLVRNGVRMTFASHGVSQAFLELSLADLRKTGGVVLVRRPDGSEIWTPPEADIEVERIEFTEFDAIEGGYREALRRPLEGIQLREVDAANFEDCLWRDMLLAFCGSAECFLHHGFGLSLCRGDELLAEGYAPLLGRSIMEIGVISAEEHRGQGLATIVSAHVIERCLERGWSVTWSCETDNPASAAVARKLGFRGEQTYPVYGYKSTKA